MTFSSSWIAMAAFLMACSKQGAEGGANPAATEARVAAVLDNAQAELPKAPLTVGTEVFNFTALAHTGQRFQLEEFLDERPALIYFCNQDASAACTQLASNIRDRWLELRPHLAMVLGVGTESTLIHRAFAGEHGLPQLLVADSKSSVHRVFGVQPGMAVSYLIGKERKVLQVFDWSKTGDHAAEVLAALQRLGLLQPAPPI